MNDVLAFLVHNPTVPVIAISAVIAYKSLRSQRHLARAKHAIDFQSDYHASKEAQHHNRIVRESTRTLTWDETAALAAPGHFNDEVVISIREVLNAWEKVAIAIQSDVYDEDILYNAYGSYVVGTWMDLRAYTQVKQAANPRLYVRLDWLAIRWMCRRQSDLVPIDLKKLQRAQGVITAILHK